MLFEPSEKVFAFGKIRNFPLFTLHFSLINSAPTARAVGALFILRGSTRIYNLK